jgi:hypothetical protein
MTRNGKITLTLVATAIMLVSSYNYAKLMTRTWCDYHDEPWEAEDFVAATH